MVCAALNYFGFKTCGEWITLFLNQGQLLRYNFTLICFVAPRLFQPQTNGWSWSSYLSKGLFLPKVCFDLFLRIHIRILFNQLVNVNTQNQHKSCPNGIWITLHSHTLQPYKGIITEDLSNTDYKQTMTRPKIEKICQQHGDNDLFQVLHWYLRTGAMNFIF